MKRLNIFLAFVFLLLTSCVTDEVDYVGGNLPESFSDNAFHVIGSVEDFDIKHVSTRSSDEVSDLLITEMTMFIFDKNDNLIQGYKNRIATFDAEGKLSGVSFEGCTPCSSAINIQKGNPTFLVDTENGLIASYEGESQTLIYYDNFTKDNLMGCKIYIVANVWHQLEGKVDTITKLSELESFVLDIDDTLHMPKKDDGHYRGFPMIGTPLNTTFNLPHPSTLASNEKNTAAVANIPLKKLYSKVRFTMQVCANQVVAGQTPKFEIEKVEVFNVPAKARLGRKLDSAGKPEYNDKSNNSDDYINEVANDTISESNIGEYYHYTGTEPFTITDFDNGKTVAYHNSSLDQTDDLIEFGFYMPEHKVTPNAITYPSGMPDDCKQYYKPLGVGATRSDDGLVNMAKIATYVRIHGSYTDHNGQIKSVRYDIYLGQNEIDDFTVKRNQQLNNKLVITGLTNYYDAYNGGDNISIDHRVDVDYKGFNLSMERTAILDAHFEVRPLDIELSPGSTMKITIPEAYRSWVAMESDQLVRKNYDSNIYVSNEERKAVRKYFTTDLVSELNGNGTRGNGGTITINHSNTANTTEIYRIWLYIDENINVYDKLLGESADKGGITASPSDGSYAVYGKNDKNAMYRVCPIEFKYYGTDYDNTGGGNTTVSKTETINLQQWNLWRVWSSDKKRYYDIEHEEEYLNNYASDQKYGQTQDGMAYGLDGIQLSNNIFASWKQKTSTGWFASIIDAIFNTSGTTSNVFASSGKEPYYDFYLSRDNFPIAYLDDTSDENVAKYRRDYSGIQFNREIATILKASTNPKAKIDGIILTEDPQSAFAYCYHKNKRNSSGVVETQKWFLPAIDEIEDIALGAYEEFDRVFQNEEYWSCQPAYERYTMKLTGNNYLNLGLWKGYVPLDGLGGVLEGEFFIDNTNRARSTSVYTTDGTNYANIKSGIPSTEYGGHLDVQAYKDGPKDNTAEATYSPNTVNYNADIYTTGEYRGNSSRGESCRIRAVYRSGTK